MPWYMVQPVRGVLAVAALVLCAVVCTSDCLAAQCWHSAMKMDTYRGPVCPQLMADLLAVDAECRKHVVFIPRGRGPLFNPAMDRRQGRVMEKEGAAMERHMDRHAAVDQPRAVEHVARLCSDPALRPPPEAATMSVTVALLGVVPIILRAVRVTTAMTLAQFHDLSSGTAATTTPTRSGSTRTRGWAP